MDEKESLKHTKWEYKYHVVLIPKCRRKVLHKELRPYVGEVFRRLAEQKEIRIEEGHLMADHVHIMMAIPPKYAVSQVIGYIKGRARFIWPGFTESGRGILWASTSGQEGSLCPRWAGTRL
jgi:REP-associated tyrosine transposase